MQVTEAEVEAAAGAIYTARSLEPFAKASRHDREYNILLARAALEAAAKVREKDLADLIASMTSEPDQGEDVLGLQRGRE